MQPRRPVITTPVGHLPQGIQTPGCPLLTGGANADSIAQAIQQAVRLDTTDFAEDIARAVEQVDATVTARKLLQAISQSV